MKQLERFESNPMAYRPGGSTGAPVHFTAALVDEFLAWSETTQKNSATWVGQQRMYLEWWRGNFESQDLRAVTLPEILAALEGVKSRGHRIAVVKRLYSWLVRERHVMREEQNPTAQLRIPQARPEQWTRQKAISKRDFTRIRAKLSGHWRDALDILAGTGWHVTELVRFARSGSLDQHAGQPVLICPQTKGGEMLRTEVSRGVAKAARRLRSRGAIDRDKFDDEVRAASRACKVDFMAGQMRHSVATWAVNQGADAASVAAFLGHKSPRTTARFYATHATPKKVPTLL
jgi:integrase